MASPKKLKNPIISVNVVKTTELPTAGSIPNFFKVRGITVPKNPANVRFIIIDAAITKPRSGM